MKTFLCFSCWDTWSVLCICSDRVQSLCYLQLTRQLVSCSSDGGIAVWNMDVSREEVRGKGKATLMEIPKNPPSRFSSLQYKCWLRWEQSQLPPVPPMDFCLRVLHVILHCYLLPTWGFSPMTSSVYSQTAFKLLALRNKSTGRIRNSQPFSTSRDVGYPPKHPRAL